MDFHLLTVGDLLQVPDVVEAVSPLEQRLPRGQRRLVYTDIVGEAGHLFGEVGSSETLADHLSMNDRIFLFEILKETEGQLAGVTHGAEEAQCGIRFSPRGLGASNQFE